MRYLLIAAILSTLPGCTSVRYTAIDAPSEARTAVAAGSKMAPRVDTLSAALVALGPGVSSGEARILAETALRYSLQQAELYQLTRPPLVHNMLVNAGLKPRGLCIHWTEDLLSKLHDLDAASFDLWWGVASRPTPFHVEHSTVVVTAKGEPFVSGLVLDGWRDSGWLYWAPVTADKYRWNVMGNYISGTGLEAAAAY